MTLSSSGRPGGVVPGGVVRVYGDGRTDGGDGALIPYCCISQAQLSYHGYKDAVKFFVAVPGLPVTGGGLHQSAESDEVVQTRDSKDQETGREIMLVIAGGEGYVDFRRGGETVEPSDGETLAVTSQQPVSAERSHLLAWQVFTDSS